MSEYYVGVMSGTSLDGVDVALCEVDNAHCNLIHSYEHPFPLSLKKEILSAISGPITLQQFGTLDSKLGMLFGDAINALLEKKSILREKIVAIGLHGQTLWHAPEGAFGFSLQLGNANIVHAKTGIQIVADLRGGDIAHGGEGAPFAPAFHQFLFSSHAPCAVINIGGMANITLLEKEKVLGWDIGCGNVLLDSFIALTQAKQYDKAGAFARSGSLKRALLDAMLEDAYFKKNPPKSTGREYFHLAWFEHYTKQFPNLNKADIQRTLLELTAKTIADTLNHYTLKEAIFCGGGIKNSFLMERIDALTQCKVTTTDAYDINSDFLEAMLFAWLAYKRLHHEKVALKTVTGAKENVMLGAIYG